MPFDDLHFSVNDTLIPWGSTLTEAEARLPGHPWRKPYGGWPNLRGACQSVLGLAATECNLRAPAPEKPIMQASYELAAPASATWQAAVPEPWLSVLTALLGPPTSADTYNDEWHRNPGSVVYAARWEQPTVHIALSVYGGVRHEEGGPTAAGLFLDWRDEVAAARPFLAAAQAQAAALQAVVTQAGTPLIFKTQYPQYGYEAPTTTEPALTPAADLLRQSKRALYRNGLLETPSQIHAQLSDHQIALWPVPGRPAWAVSTRWDTMLLTAAGPVPELVNLRPAKGSGNVQFSIGSLHLSDAYATPGLAALATAIEQQTGQPVSRVEEYDC